MGGVSGQSVYFYKKSKKPLTAVTQLSKFCPSPASRLKVAAWGGVPVPSLFFCVVSAIVND